MLFAMWDEKTPRPTQDIDLLSFGPTALEEIAAIVGSGRSQAIPTRCISHQRASAANRGISPFPLGNLTLAHISRPLRLAVQSARPDQFPFQETAACWADFGLRKRGCRAVYGRRDELFTYAPTGLDMDGSRGRDDYFGVEPRGDSTRIHALDSPFRQGNAFSIYGLLATLTLRGLGSRRWAPWLAIAAVSLFGVSDEWHQSFVPGRSCEVADWVADTLGAALAVSLYRRWGFYRRLLEFSLLRPTRVIEGTQSGQ